MPSPLLAILTAPDRPEARRRLDELDELLDGPATQQQLARLYVELSTRNPDGETNLDGLSEFDTLTVLFAIEAAVLRSLLDAGPPPSLPNLEPSRN